MEHTSWILFISCISNYFWPSYAELIPPWKFLWNWLQISQCALREHKIEVDFLFIAKKNQLNCTKQDSMYQERNLKVETSTMLTNLYI